jgi:hypothetical protein
MPSTTSDASRAACRQLVAEIARRLGCVSYPITSTSLTSRTHAFGFRSTPSCSGRPSRSRASLSFSTRSPGVETERRFHLASLLSMSIAAWQPVSLQRSFRNWRALTFYSRPFWRDGHGAFLVTDVGDGFARRPDSPASRGEDCSLLPERQSAFGGCEYECGGAGSCGHRVASRCHA